MAGEHDGFAPLTHVREITSIHGVGWIIVDRIVGDAPAMATAYWHIHPDWTLVRIDAGEAIFRHLDGPRVVLRSSSPLREAAGQGLDEYAPEYGRVERATCLEATVRDDAPLQLRTVIAAHESLDRALALASSVHS
jgi:hypothetical protein